VPGSGGGRDSRLFAAPARGGGGVLRSADLSVLLSLFPAYRCAGWQWVLLVLAAPVTVWAAWPFHRAAVVNARHGSRPVAAQPGMPRSRTVHRGGRNRHRLRRRRPVYTENSGQWASRQPPLPSNYNAGSDFPQVAFLSISSTRTEQCIAVGRHPIGYGETSATASLILTDTIAMIDNESHGLTRVLWWPITSRYRVTGTSYPITHSCVTSCG
jgi:hypothetical protein